MTDNELKELVPGLILAQKETDKQIQETSRQIKATDQEMKDTFKEIRAMQKETAKQIKENWKLIGGLGEKFGSFTEGLALPSMQKILQKQFKMEVISPSVRISKDGQHLKIDVMAYSNSDVNGAYIVEVKSHVREEAIQQLHSILTRFRQFFPEHKDKKVYGILAAVDMSDYKRERILKRRILCGKD